MRSMLPVLIALAMLTPTAAGQPKTEKFQGYAEWRKDHDLVVDGQRVTTDQRTRFKAKVAVSLAGVFTLAAFINGYGRDLEDQADRVALRYAYEAGYDVRRGPTLWQRFKDKHGDQNRIVNFFLGNHSVATARIRNLNREIALNYRER